jgi:hypothetical protein
MGEADLIVLLGPLETLPGLTHEPALITIFLIGK